MGLIEGLWGRIYGSINDLQSPSSHIVWQEYHRYIYNIYQEVETKATDTKTTGEFFKNGSGHNTSKRGFKRRSVTFQRRECKNIN